MEFVTKTDVGVKRKNKSICLKNVTILHNLIIKTGILYIIEL